MIALTNTTHILELGTSSTSGVDVYVSYVDITSSGGTLGDNQVSISTATTTTILSAPGVSTQRQIKLISVENKGTTSNIVTIKKDISGTEYILYSATLQPGENLTYSDGNGFDKHSKAGDDTSMSVTNNTAPISATSLSMLKVGATTEAVGVIHSLALSSGNPGVWSPGTPGINGRATDGTTSADAGCFPVRNPSSGNNYLTSFVSSATTASTQLLLDVMWVNTGIVVTTTTAQTITPVTLPARDTTGTTNGEDVIFGILVTTATTNASAVTNTTLSYTNSDGTAGRTATMPSFPATAVAGTFVPFLLQAGDKGIRSVQSITLGTSYVTGAISLVGYRVISGAPQLVANAGGNFQPSMQGINTRLYNGTCLLPFYIPTATTATTVFSIINIEEK